MERRRLGKTDIEVSFIGFGCVQLTTHESKKEAIDTLECAYSQGITHFDVARSYGFGRAEGILSDFIRNKRDQVTVATKFGIEPPSGLSGNPKLISFAKKILSPFPKLLKRAKNRGTTMVKSGIFKPDVAQKSLEKSLRELKTDYIDIFLLHEATPSDFIHEPLIDMLEKQVQNGKIRCFGIASDFGKINSTLNSIPKEHTILQFNENPIDQNIQKLSLELDYGIITHSIFNPLSVLLNVIDKNSKIAQEFTSKFGFGIDLCDPNTLSHLLLHYALEKNKNGCVLFSSTKRSNIESNIHSSRSLNFSDEQLSGFIQFANVMVRDFQ